MKLETKFNIGNTVYAVGRAYNTDKYSVHSYMTVDFISVDIVKGGICDEIYHCDESNEWYNSDDVFLTWREAKAHADKLNKDLAK